MRPPCKLWHTWGPWNFQPKGADYGWVFNKETEQLSAPHQRRWCWKCQALQITFEMQDPDQPTTEADVRRIVREELERAKKP